MCVFFFLAVPEVRFPRVLEPETLSVIIIVTVSFDIMLVLFLRLLSSLVLFLIDLLPL